MAEKPPASKSNDILSLDKGNERAVKNKRRRMIGAVAAGVCLSTVAGAGAGIIGKGIDAFHGAMPREEVSVEGSHGTVIEMMSASPVCAVAYGVDAGAKVTAVNKVLNMPTGSLSAVVDRVRVNSELCQEATTIEKIYDQDEDHMTFNVPVDAFYVKSGVDFAAKENGKDVLDMEMQGEGLEILVQLSHAVTQSVGVIRDTGIGKGLDARESGLTALAMLESQRVASEVCGPEVASRGLDMYEEGLIEVVKVGAPEGTTFDVNFVDSNGESAVNEDGSLTLEKEMPWRDVFGDEVIDIEAELAKTQSENKDALTIAGNKAGVECSFDENIATDKIGLVAAAARPVDTPHGVADVR